VTVVKKDGTLVGVFTDGDLRRKIQQEGRDVLKKNLKDFEYGKPVSIEGDALLNDANALFKKFNVDTLLVTDNGKPVGMLDIQDMRANASK
jgi:signal-transduction protein with cAMP-binding, CBS, and nucleotidyltransferase domain